MNTEPMSRPATLYLIQDSPLVGSRLLKAFRRFGNVCCIGTGRFSARTLATIAAVAPDLVVLDAGVGNPDLLVRLRKVGDAAGVATVLLLVHAGSAAMRQRYRDAGADFCFDVALEFDAFVRCLAELGKVCGPGRTAGI